MIKPEHAYCKKTPCRVLSFYHGRRLHHGSSTVELAFTIGFFIVILISSIIGSFLMYSYIVTDYLAREGMLYAIKRGSMMAADPLRTTDNYANEDRIRALLTNKKLLPSLSVTACWAGSPSTPYPTVPCSGGNPGVNNGYNNVPGMPVRVTVTHDFVVPLISNLWPTTITLSSTAQGTIIF